jgi:hypothetical protein
MNTWLAMSDETKKNVGVVAVSAYMVLFFGYCSVEAWLRHSMMEIVVPTAVTSMVAAVFSVLFSIKLRSDRHQSSVRGV